MRHLLAAIFLLSIVTSCKKKQAEEQQSLISDRRLMPRQVMPAWPLGTVGDTCIDITGNLITGSISIKTDPLGTYCNFSAGRGSHNLYDSMGFEMDKLEATGRHYGYFYLYNPAKRYLYKIGTRSRKGNIFTDTTLIAYVDDDRSYTLSMGEDGILAVITSRYNNKKQIVSEQSSFYYPNLRSAAAGPERLRYLNKFYYTGDKIDSLVTFYPANKPPFGKLKLVYDNKGLPARALIENDSMYSAFQVTACKDSTVFDTH